MALSEEKIEELKQLKLDLEEWKVRKTSEIYKQVAILKSIKTPIENLSTPIVNKISEKAREVIESAEESNEETEQ